MSIGFIIVIAVIILLSAIGGMGTIILSIRQNKIFSVISQLKDKQTALIRQYERLDKIDTYLKKQLEMSMKNDSVMKKLL